MGYGGKTSLIEHWNGSAWSIATGAVSSARLYSITALSASNIWVVGETGNRAVTPVVEHFDGTAWHLVAQPVFTYDSFLISISAAGPNDIWAVGGRGPSRSRTKERSRMRMIARLALVLAPVLVLSGIVGSQLCG